MNLNSAAGLPLQILWIKPATFLHAESLREAVEAVHHGLRQAGIEAPISENRLLPGRLPIVFGAHLLNVGEEAQLPPSTIIYNLEQFGLGYAGSSPRYLNLLSRFRVWDGLPSQTAHLRYHGINAATQHVPLGYVPQLSRVPTATEDIDILFYGTASPRRRNVLDALRTRGLNVVAVNGVFGAERDALVARAKVVLNMHFAEGGKLEVPRLLYLLANRKAIVSEEATDTAACGLADCFVEVPYEQLVAACIELGSDNARRRATAERGFQIVSSGAGFGDTLRYALDTLPADLPRPSRLETLPAFPRTLNIGSGRKFLPWCVNADTNAASRPDWELDISSDLLFGRVMACSRLGDTELRKGMFDAVIADHLLEHVADLPAAMANILALLAEGGKLYAEVPYDLSYGAWQDPYHLRAFNERSWLYYTDWHAYLGWTQARFDLDNIQFGPSDHGRRLLAEGLPMAEVLLRPRAIDVMQVELRKRSLVQG